MLIKQEPGATDPREKVARKHSLENYFGEGILGPKRISVTEF